MSQDVASTGRSDLHGGLSQSVARHLKNYFKLVKDGGAGQGLYEVIITQVEKPLIELALDFCHNNQIATAELLGINRNTLRKKIAQLSIVMRDSYKKTAKR